MNRETHKPDNREPGSLLELFKNTKFIVLNALVLAVLAFALLSGDGKKIALNFYERITGQQFESFSPVEAGESSSPAYISLKYTLLERKKIRIENANVTRFKASETSYKYRVASGDDVLFYQVRKDSNGVWQINELQDK